VVRHNDFLCISIMSPSKYLDGAILRQLSLIILEEKGEVQRKMKKTPPSLNSQKRGIPMN